jgi:hypothetical protein
LPEQVSPLGHVPQLTMPPHPSGTVPQLSPAGHIVSGTHVHTPLLHTSVPGHAVQTLPPVPHEVADCEAYGSQVFPLQHPFGHEVALQTHPAFVHCWPAAHCAAPLHVHAPAVHPLAIVVLQAVHAPPPVPQFVTDGVWQVVPEQQPDAQLLALHVGPRHVSSVEGVIVDWHVPPVGHCAFEVHCTQAPLSTSPVPVAHTGVAPVHWWPSSAHVQCRQPAGVVGVPVQRGGTLVLDATQALSSMLQRFCTFHVWAPTVMVESVPHTSPISPHVRPVAYHPIG